MAIKKLFLHTSTYSIGSLLVTVAGFISFPIFTRIFTVEEYGLLNLISSTLLILTGIAKLGVQNSIVRFHGDVLTGKKGCSLAQFYSLVLIAMAAAGAVTAIAWALLSQVIPLSWLNDPRLQGLFLLTSVLILLRVVDSGLINILRAEQRTIAYSVYAVIKKYAGIGTIIVFLFYISRDLKGFYAATILTETASIMVLVYLINRAYPLSTRGLPTPVYRDMLAYGIPMVGYEIGGIVLNVGDRYVIQGLLGGESLGAYSAAYNLCEYVQAIIIASVGQAVMPIYMRIWAEKGPEATRQFIQKSLFYYLLVSLPVIAGLSAVGPELLLVLASEKYQQGTVVIPYVISGMIIDGALIIFGAGLYIHKKTVSIMVLLLAISVVNIALNFLLVPGYGILGAAIATLVSYILLVIIAIFISRSFFPVSMPWTAFFKFGTISLAMYLVLGEITLAGHISTIIARMAAGVVFYAILIILFDKSSREVFVDVAGKLRKTYFR